MPTDEELRQFWNARHGVEPQAGFTNQPSDLPEVTTWYDLAASKVSPSQATALLDALGHTNAEAILGTVVHQSVAEMLLGLPEAVVEPEMIQKRIRGRGTVGINLRGKPDVYYLDERGRRTVIDVKSSVYSASQAGAQLSAYARLVNAKRAGTLTPTPYGKSLIDQFVADIAGLPSEEYKQLAEWQKDWATGHPQMRAWLEERWPGRVAAIAAQFGGVKEGELTGNVTWQSEEEFARGQRQLFPKMMRAVRTFQNLGEVVSQVTPEQRSSLGSMLHYQEQIKASEALIAQYSGTPRPQVQFPRPSTTSSEVAALLQQAQGPLQNIPMAQDLMPSQAVAWNKAFKQARTQATQMSFSQGRVFLYGAGKEGRRGQRIGAFPQLYPSEEMGPGGAWRQIGPRTLTRQPWFGTGYEGIQNPAIVQAIEAQPNLFMPEAAKVRWRAAQLLTGENKFDPWAWRYTTPPPPEGEEWLSRREGRESQYIYPTSTLEAVWARNAAGEFLVPTSAVKYDRPGHIASTNVLKRAQLAMQDAIVPSDRSLVQASVSMMGNVPEYGAVYNTAIMAGTLFSPGQGFSAVEDARLTSVKNVGFKAYIAPAGAGIMPEGAEMLLPFPKDWISTMRGMFSAMSPEKLRGLGLPMRGDVLDWTGETHQQIMEAGWQYINRPEHQRLTQAYPLSVRQENEAMYDWVPDWAWRTRLHDVGSGLMSGRVTMPTWVVPELLNRRMEYPGRRPRLNPEELAWITEQYPEVGERLSRQGRYIREPYTQVARAALGNLEATPLTDEQLQRIGYTVREIQPEGRPGLNVVLEAFARNVSEPFSLSSQGRSFAMPSPRELQRLSADISLLPFEEATNIRSQAAVVSGASRIMANALGMGSGKNQLARIPALYESWINRITRAPNFEEGISAGFLSSGGWRRAVFGTVPKRAMEGPYLGSTAIKPEWIVAGDEALMEMYKIGPKQLPGLKRLLARETVAYGVLRRPWSNIPAQGSRFYRLAHQGMVPGLEFGDLGNRMAMNPLGAFLGYGDTDADRAIAYLASEVGQNRGRWWARGGETLMASQKPLAQAFHDLMSSYSPRAAAMTPSELYNQLKTDVNEAYSWTQEAGKYMRGTSSAEDVIENVHADIIGSKGEFAERVTPGTLLDEMVRGLQSKELMQYTYQTFHRAMAPYMKEPWRQAAWGQMTTASYQPALDVQSLSPQMRTNISAAIALGGQSGWMAKRMFEHLGGEMQFEPIGVGAGGRGALSRNLLATPEFLPSVRAAALASNEADLAKMTRLLESGTEEDIATAAGMVKEDAPFPRMAESVALAREMNRINKEGGSLSGWSEQQIKDALSGQSVLRRMDLTSSGGRAFLKMMDDLGRGIASGAGLEKVVASRATKELGVKVGAAIDVYTTQEIPPEVERMRRAAGRRGFPPFNQPPGGGGGGGGGGDWGDWGGGGGDIGGWDEVLSAMKGFFGARPPIAEFPSILEKAGRGALEGADLATLTEAGASNTLLKSVQAYNASRMNIEDVRAIQKELRRYPANDQLANNLRLSFRSFAGDVDIGTGLLPESPDAENLARAQSNLASTLDDVEKIYSRLTPEVAKSIDSTKELTNQHIRQIKLLAGASADFERVATVVGGMEGEGAEALQTRIDEMTGRLGPAMLAAGGWGNRVSDEALNAMFPQGGGPGFLGPGGLRGAAGRGLRAMAQFWPLFQARRVYGMTIGNVVQQAQAYEQREIAWQQTGMMLGAPTQYTGVAADALEREYLMTQTREAFQRGAYTVVNPLQRLVAQPRVAEALGVPTAIGGFAIGGGLLGGLAGSILAAPAAGGIAAGAAAGFMGGFIPGAVIGATAGLGSYAWGQAQQQNIGIGDWINNQGTRAQIALAQGAIALNEWNFGRGMRPGTEFLSPASENERLRQWIETAKGTLPEPTIKTVPWIQEYVENYMDSTEHGGGTLDKNKLIELVQGLAGAGLTEEDLRAQPGLLGFVEREAMAGRDAIGLMQATAQAFGMPKPSQSTISWLQALSPEARKQLPFRLQRAQANLQMLQGIHGVSEEEARRITSLGPVEQQRAYQALQLVPQFERLGLIAPPEILNAPENILSRRVEAWGRGLQIAEQRMAYAMPVSSVQELSPLQYTRQQRYIQAREGWRELGYSFPATYGEMSPEQLRMNQIQQGVAGSWQQQFGTSLPRGMIPTTTFGASRVQALMQGSPYAWSSALRGAGQMEAANLIDPWAFANQVYGIQTQQIQANREYRDWGLQTQLGQIGATRAYYGRIRGLQDAMTGLGYRQAMAGFNYQDQMRELQQRQFMENWNLQQEQFQLGTAYQRQNMTIGWQTGLMQRGWQREDWERGEAMTRLQYGWQMEDMNRAIRYAQGPQRAQLLRERRRANVMENERRDVFDEQKDRQEELWRLADEQHQRDVQYFEENTRLQEERLDMSKRHFEERNELEDDYQDKIKGYYKERQALEQAMQKEQRAWQDEQLDWQEDSIEKQIEHNEEMDKYDDALRGLQKRRDDALAAIEWWLFGGGKKPEGAGGDGAVMPAWLSALKDGKDLIKDLADAIDDIDFGGRGGGGGGGGNQTTDDKSPGPDPGKSSGDPYVPPYVPPVYRGPNRGQETSSPDLQRLIAAVYQLGNMLNIKLEVDGYQVATAMKPYIEQQMYDDTYH